MLSNSRKVSCLKSKTGWSHKVTHEFLKENNWNLEQAVNAYDLMIEASLVPLKNSNVLQEQNKSNTNNFNLHSHTPCMDKKKGKVSKKPGIQTQKEKDGILEGKKDKSQLDDLSEAVFMLPDISKFGRMSDAFKQVLINEFINTSTQELLVKSGQLNWWTNLGLQPLFPLVTTGDGNCLLHAASIALNGISDENLTLRSELYYLITSPHHKQAFYRRWRLQQTINNKESGLVYSEDEWLNEWTSITAMASPDPINNEKSCDTGSCNNSSQDNISYSSLEEIHLFVLAHLLARPVIVVADDFYKNSKGEAIAPIPFSGIYLPIQLSPNNCHKTPIHIAYNAAHFMAVCPLDCSLAVQNSEVSLCSAYVPLVDSKFNLMPLHFFRDPGDNFEEDYSEISERKQLEEKYTLLEKYFEIDMISLSGADGKEEIKDGEINNHPINNNTITNDLYGSEEKVPKQYKGLEKLKRFAESTGANLKKTFHKSVFSKIHHHRKQDDKTSQAPVQLNNATTYCIDSFLTRCKIPTARAIYLRQELYAENIEEYINATKIRLAERGDIETLTNNNSSSINNSINDSKTNSIYNSKSNSNNNSMAFEDFSNIKMFNNNNTMNNNPNNKHNDTPTNEQQLDQRKKQLSNKIINNFKTHKIHDKNLFKLNKLKDINYFNKSFDEAKNRIRISKELDEKARRVLFCQGGLIRNSMSETFKSYQALSSARLDKFTKVDNRMITATETNACDFNDDSLCDRKVPPKAEFV